MKFTFKSIVSVLTSAVMLSSTVALAAAANYPAPFVQNGAANVAVVWGGSDAAQTDLVAAQNIAANLQTKVTGTTTATTSSEVVGGDSVLLAKSSDNWNLGNDAATVFGSTVTKDDLPDLLADGTYTNDENTDYDYEQKLTLGGALDLSFFADSDYKDKEPTIGIKFASSAVVLNYTLDFTTDPESDVSSSDLADFETTDISILGRDYYILDSKNGTSVTYLGKLTLLDSANSVIVKEGESKTMTVGAKSYEISIESLSGTASSPKVQLTINGETTNTLGNGETQQLTDGTWVGVKETLMRDIAGNVASVELSLGSGKLEIDSGSDIELNDDSINGLKGYVYRGSVSGDKQRMDKIVIEWKTDEEAFVTADSSVSLPGFGSLKLSSAPFVTPAKEITTVDYDGDDSIELNVPIKDGDANFNILYANASGELTGIGKSTDERLATSSNTTLFVNVTDNRDRYFVASYNSSSDSESYLLSLSVTESDGKNRTTIKNEVTGNNACEDKVANDVCNIGDVSLTISDVYKVGSTKTVLLLAGTGVSFDKVYSKTGLKIQLPYETTTLGTMTGDGAINLSAVSSTAGHSPASFYLFMTEENKDDNVATGTKFNVTVDDDSDGDLGVSDVDTGQSDYDVVGTSDDTVSMVYSDLATQVKRIVVSDRGKAEVEYHGSESYGELFLSDTSATVTTTATGAGAIVPITDSEAAAVTGKNLIVVGGSCINSVAAGLLGGALCGADFEGVTTVGAGEFLIQTFARTDGTVATLVAGYNADDTTNAATYFRTQTVDTTAGKKYVGTTATAATLVV